MAPNLAVLPENFAAMGSHDSYRVGIAEADGRGPIQDFLSAAASRNGIWIAGGTLPLQSDDPQRPYASCLVFDAQGRRVARYDKMHLFDVAVPGSEEDYRESANTMPGGNPLLVDFAVGRIGCCRMLRSAIPRDVPDSGRWANGYSDITGSVYIRNRSGALGNFAAVTRHRKSLLCGGRRADRITSGWPPYLGSFDDCRPVGTENSRAR